MVELTGANDGMNTLVPYADDAYYRLRPRIGIRADKVRKIDDHYGFNPSMSGFEKLYKDGRMAIIHGCGYEQPSFSHFTSAAYWHTGVPNGGERFGWLGRVADAIDPALSLVTPRARQAAPRERGHCSEGNERRFLMSRHHSDWPSGLPRSPPGAFPYRCGSRAPISTARKPPGPTITG